MKFNKKIPKNTGYYWGVNIEWPSPQIFFLQYPQYWQCCNSHAYNLEQDKDRMRWGDQIVPPSPTENELEYL